MKRIFFLLVILVISISACEEDNDKLNYNFKGRVLDYYTGEGISNATVYIRDRSLDPSNQQMATFNLYDTTTIIGRIYTDTNGNFNKSFEVEKGSQWLVVYDSKYISSDTMIISTDIANDIIMKVKKFKTLTVTLRNKNDIADSLYLLINSYNQVSQHFIINAVDTTIVFNKAIPEAECSIQCNLRKEGVIQMSVDTVKMISKSDVDHIEIEY